MATQEEKNKKIPGLDFPLVLYDGYCNLCSRAVKTILKHEKKPIYFFLSLQSPKTSQFAPGHVFPDPPETVVLIENGKIYDKSTAALKISGNLKFPYWLMYYFIFIPRFIRDPMYKLVAKNRYRWFGKRNSCYVPGQKWKHRFLD